MVAREFTTIDGRWRTRQVHYRRAGTGPALLMLHQSPLSSADLLPLIEPWQRHFTIIAPDTPGYGLSDPLGVAEASIADYAAATGELLDALGIDRFGVYGFHTGGSIALELARQRPQQVAACTINGLAAFNEAERDDLLTHYLPPFVPRWDGSHLAWLWSRLREQYVFFPWHDHRRAARMHFDMPPPAYIQNAAVEILRADDHYRSAYRAAFAYPGGPLLADVTVPTLVTAAPPDPLVAHLERINGAPATVEVERSADRDAATQRCLDFLTRHPGTEPPAPPGTTAIPGRSWQQYVQVDGANIRVRRHDEGEGAPVVLLHDAAGSTDLMAPVADGLVGRRPVIAVELPGHGETDPVVADDDVTVAAYAEHVAAVLDALGIDTPVDIFGLRLGGLVALEWSRQAPSRVRSLALCSPGSFDDAELADLRANYAPEIVLDWYGGHLLHAWHMVRDQRLYWPWYRRERAAILDCEPHLDTRLVHQRVLELMRAPTRWRHAYRAQFDYPVEARLADARGAVTLCSPASDPLHDRTAGLQARFPHHPFRTLPDPEPHWAELIATLND